MIQWVDFENDLMRTHFHKIDNSSNENIVLFGSCHMAVIGYILNEIFQKKYNITIIISWYFKHIGYERFDMRCMNQRIQEIIGNSNIFIYMKHYNDYGIGADHIERYVNSTTIKIKIPNLRLDYYQCPKEKYLESLRILLNSIQDSDFHSYRFIVDHHRQYIFFNTSEHPTHYVLYLLSQSIIHKIKGISFNENLEWFLKKENREKFIRFGKNYVILPGKNKIDEAVHENTGISLQAQYFDIDF